jgi:hypothetical protein
LGGYLWLQKFPHTPYSGGIWFQRSYS